MYLSHGSVCKQSVNAMFEILLAEQGNRHSRAGCDGSQLAKQTPIRVSISISNNMVSSELNLDNKPNTFICSVMTEHTIVF